MLAIERLTDPVDAVGESPVWRATEGALYWVDIVSRRIRRWHAETRQTDSWLAPEMVGCIAFEADRVLIAGLESGIFRLHLSPGGAISATRLAAPRFAMTDMRFNDGKCDRQGRFWAGTMHKAIPAGHAVGELYRYTDEQGLSGAMQDGLVVQNGLAWSPKGERMYLSDSGARVALVWDFDYDIDSGTPANRRVFVDLKPYGGRPDGAAVDVDGCYWTCAADAGALLRFTPQGKLDRRIDMPVRKPTMCAFGGAGYDTLYVTSIRPKDEAQLAGQPLAGALFALRPGVQGLPETEFARRQ